MCFALFMVMLDNTVTNVALPSIQRDFDASLSALEWTINAYTLTFAVLLVTGGRLGDIFGRRRVFLIGVVVFAAASATIGFAPTEGWLVASRAIQGIGAALMMPATLSIITNAFPPHERGKAIGTWAGVSAIALALGPVLGGWLTEDVSGARSSSSTSRSRSVAVAVTLFAAQESRDETASRKVDFPGIADAHRRPDGARAGPRRGQRVGLGLGAHRRRCSRLAVIGLAAFVVIERRSDAPIVDFQFFRSRSFVGANLVAFAVSFAMFAMFFFIALYMQNILGYGPLEAGLRFLPSTLVIMVAGPLAGRLADRVGPRPPLVTGLLFIAVSLVWQSRDRRRHDVRLPARPVRPHGPRHGPRDVADEHGRHERRRPHQGRRRLRHAVDEPDGRRHVRRRRPRRAGRRGRPLEARRAAARACPRPRASGSPTRSAPAPRRAAPADVSRRARGVRLRARPA